MIGAAYACASYRRHKEYKAIAMITSIMALSAPVRKAIRIDMAPSWVKVVAMAAAARKGMNMVILSGGWVKGKKKKRPGR